MTREERQTFRAFLRSAAHALAMEPPCNASPMRAREVRFIAGLWSLWAGVGVVGMTVTMVVRDRADVVLFAKLLREALRARGRTFLTSSSAREAITLGTAWFAATAPEAVSDPVAGEHLRRIAQATGELLTIVTMDRDCLWCGADHGADTRGPEAAP